MIFAAWAIKWGVPAAALADLENELGLNGLGDMPEKAGTSEAAVQNQVRLEAAQKGARLYRNNVGAYQDDRGVFVRYGLANDSAQMNKIIKSADLVGWRTRIVTPDMVGQKIAQFLSREIKRPGWVYKGDAHEVAQMNWATLVVTAGGDAGFACGKGTL